MRIGIACLLLLLSVSSGFSQDLVSDQLKYERVRQAKADYDARLTSLFESKGLQYPPQEIYFRAFKFDKQLELWVGQADSFILVKTYDICDVSGELGPKLRRGDNQIPEGFYQLQEFNPVSNYYLSLKVNYPNASDRIRGYAEDLGGDIYIHGDCVTIGCIPMRDEPIKEIYWLSVLTRQAGGKIPIHIFPFRMDTASRQFFQQLHLFDEEDWEFWNQLLPAYTYFESTRLVPDISVSQNGRYVLLKKKHLVNN